MMPALCSLVLNLLLIIPASGQIPLDKPLFIAGSDDLLQYDDGTAAWFVYDDCGVWFDTQDFVPGSAGGSILHLQFWFYHHSSYPWDIASFYAELWNGDENGPVVQQDQTSVTALHYSPVYADYSPSLPVGQDFWGIVNTELSAGGWPSSLADDSPNFTGWPHSFVEGLGGWVGWDLMIRAYIPNLQLVEESWGSIKRPF